MIDNPTPSHWAFICGAFQALAGLAFLVFPSSAVAAFLRGFPRAEWTGRILAVITWILAAWATMVLPLDFLRPVQQPQVLVPLTAALAFLTCWWMPELLACRAVAGILMLFPCPLFLAVRAHPSAWRIALVVYAYIAAIKGMVIMFSPYHMRRACFCLADRPALQKTIGIVFLLIGIFFITLAYTALR